MGRCGQSPQQILAQISDTVFPMFKAFVEPDLARAAIRIRNAFNPFSGFLHAATYTLKSAAPERVDVEAAKAVVARYALATSGGGGAVAGASDAATPPQLSPAAAASVVVDEEHEETVDLYLLPPGEDAETCRDWCAACSVQEQEMSAAAAVACNARRSSC